MKSKHSVMSLFKAGVFISIGILIGHYSYKLIVGTYLIDSIVSYLVVTWMVLLVLMLFTYFDLV